MLLARRRRKDLLLGEDIFVFDPVNDIAASWDTSITAGSTTYPTIYEALKSAGGSIRLKMNSSDLLTEGKWYAEIELVDNNVSSDFIYFYGSSGTGASLRYFGSSGQPQTGGIAFRATDWDPWDVGDILMLAIDVDAQLIWTGKNGAWDNGADPSSGLDPTSEFDNLVGGINLQYQLGGDGNIILHTGAAPLNYSIPVGFHPGWYEDN